jgi:hypothetical protein
MGFMGSKPSVPERDPELDRQLAEQRAENERIKQDAADKEKREKEARLRGLRGSSSLFSNSFGGFDTEETTADLGGSSTLGSGNTAA